MSEAKSSRDIRISLISALYIQLQTALNLCAAIAVNEIYSCLLSIEPPKSTVPCAFRTRHLIRFLALHFFHFNALSSFDNSVTCKVTMPGVTPRRRAEAERNECEEIFRRWKKCPSPLLIVNTSEYGILLFFFPCVNTFPLTRGFFELSSRYNFFPRSISRHRTAMRFYVVAIHPYLH